MGEQYKNIKCKFVNNYFYNFKNQKIKHETY